VSVIHLADSTVQRLYFDGQDWCVELESWHSVDRDVFSPVTTLLRIAAAILPAISGARDGRELGPRAKTLIVDRPPTRISFAARDGQFFPETYPDPPEGTPPEIAAPKRSSLPPKPQRSLTDLKGELDQLRHQVVELEALISKFEPSPSHTSNENALADEKANYTAT
jgi:hypothetical protein